MRNRTPLRDVPWSRRWFASVVRLWLPVLCAIWGLRAGIATARADGGNVWQGRAALGGELSVTSFGIFDLGLRKGAFSIELLTDTLDVRFAPEVRSGRTWIGLRVETFAAGLMTSPWTDGAPDPGRAMVSGYAGLDGGYVRYLPAGFYAGVQASARLYWFLAMDQTTAQVPGLTPLFTGEAIVGHYTSISHLWIRAGADGELSLISPHIYVEGSLRPDLPIAPRIEVRGGWADGQDFLMRTRLGGLNPYVVPLAGAAWAEFWVQNYVALRAGPSVRVPLPGRRPQTIELSLVADVAGFDGTTAIGFGALSQWRYGRWFVQGSFGAAPWIRRGAGIERVAGFVLLGANWDALRKK